MPGGWTYQADVSPYNAYIFYSAIGESEDFIYFPVAVASQIVNGTNYKFIAIVEPKSTTMNSFFALVEIYKPIQGNAYVTKVNVIE
ncbi:MAG: hypothetical protein K0S61_1262 [Anaerocolumna sp.]|jgi:hypothetical protein|nr:hypothetical protein [Anaerocolumna sp.]